MTLTNNAKPRPTFRCPVKTRVKEADPPLTEENNRINYFVSYSRKEAGSIAIDNTFVSAKRKIKTESDIRTLEKRLNTRFGTSTIKIIFFIEMGESNG